MLQGATAARVVTACGVRSRWAAVAAAVLAIGSIFFMGRYSHIALSSHFVILWALALYFEDVRSRRFAAGRHFVLGALAILVNPYLFVMVGVLQVTTYATLWMNGVVRAADWGRAALVLGGVLAIALVEGYSAIFTGSASMGAPGFGHYSWNLATLLVPPGEFWGNPTGIVRDATGGQTEGEAYIGLGAALVFVACLLVRPRRILSAVRQHWLLCTTLLACAAFAASNRIFLGSRLLLDIPLPEAMTVATSFLRVSGRFVWVPGYAIILLSLAVLVRWAPRALVVPRVALAMVAQLWEASVTLTRLRSTSSRLHPELVETLQLRSWMEAHDRMFQFPSFWCGGLVPNIAFGSRESNRELQTELLVARVGIPTNSVYTSRPLKDCPAEARWAERPVLEARVLYLLSKAVKGRTAELARLATSSACLDAGWGFVCSRDPLRPSDSSGTSAPLIAVEPKIIPVCDDSGLGTTTVHWKAPDGIRSVEVRVGQPDGPLLAVGRAGTRSTGESVSGGMIFYLMEQGKPLTEESALARATAYLMRAECGRALAPRPGPDARLGLFTTARAAFARAFKTP
ncbi:MAG: hypothetical protein HY727_17830 [Candidatus Rokubacteria bacterium]|nr:hypothetical protein [Candidatus Rokubacteria bacterium]